MIEATWHYEPWLNGDDGSWIIFRFAIGESRGWIEACTESTSEVEVKRLLDDLDHGRPLELPIDFESQFHPETEDEAGEWEDLYGAGVFRQTVEGDDTLVEVCVSEQFVEEQLFGVLNGYRNAGSTFELMRAVAPDSVKTVAESLVFGSKPLTWQSISMDEDNRKIRIYGKPLKINRLQEFQLLRELIWARGGTVSHGVLRLKIRSSNGTAHPTDTAPANVNSVIQRVRAALLELGYKDCIKSTKGEGFRFDI